MRLLRSALMLGGALTALPAAAQTAPATIATSAAVKPIAFTERTLPNGLRIYAIRDTTTPNVAIQVWYDVGGKDDPKGKSGFAHMFEHLMFKATRNLVPEQMDRLTEDVGGYNNASTGDDYTNYYEVVPANHLQRLLFAEADRMRSLVVEPTSFASERDVVKEELRQSVLARPYGKLFSVYEPAVGYSVHPYARGVIGSIDNLQAASIDDVRAFHATYYRPDNAVLVVSGNFDPAQFDRWVDQYFGPITRPTTPIPRVTVTEPARTKAMRYTVYEPNTPLPAVMVSYHLPPDRNPDIPALTVLNTILSTGESSRLYETLVYRDQLAQSADSSFDTKQATGNLVAYAILAGGKSPTDGETALKREIARFRDAPVSAAELAEAKNELLTAAIKGRETAEGKAREIASSVLIDGDPRAGERQLAAIGRVTAADIQRAARTYLKDAQSATILYLPEDAKPKAAIGDTIAIAPTVRVADLVPPRDIALVTPAGAADRIAPPAPTAAPISTIPEAVETTLANGMRLVVVERHNQPLVTATLVATGGAATDPVDRAGASTLATELMAKGTTTRSATDIARQMESLGSSIETGMDRDGGAIGVTVRPDQLSAAMGILADVAINPAFADAEIERARAQAVDANSVMMKNPAQLAGVVASRAVFGAQPYGAPLAGTPASLKAMTRQDLVTAYHRSWTPRQVTLVMVGDIDAAAARTLADARFGAWKSVSAVPGADTVVAPLPAPRIIVVDLPGSGQAGVVVARAGIARSDPRYYPLAVANGALGGGFSSRLNQEIRIKRGLAYGAGSSIQARRQPGLVSARTQTKNVTAPEVVGLIVEEMRKMGTAPASTTELDARKAVLVGGFGREIETTAGLASTIGDYVIEAVPLSELQRYTASVALVGASDVQSASAALLDPKPASIIIVGDAKQFIEPLRKTYPNVEVIPADGVRLDGAALR